MITSYSKALLGGFVAVAVMASGTVAAAFEKSDAGQGVTGYSDTGTTAFAPEQIAAGQVSSGEFGSMTGGGNYTFPAVVTAHSASGGELLNVSAAGTSRARFSASTGSGISGIQLTSNSNSWYIDNRGSNDVSRPANRLGIFNQSGTEVVSVLQNGSVVLGNPNMSAFPNFRAGDKLVVANSGSTNSAIGFASNVGTVMYRMYYNPSGGSIRLELDGSPVVNSFQMAYVNPVSGATVIPNQISYWSGAPTFFNSGANVGIGTSNPQSGLHVAQGSYAQFENQTFGAPNPADCDSSAEIGRIVIDPAARRLYVCDGPKRGWDYAQLND